MKLLNLKLKNINSLYGEFEVDFENPAFTENGLFVLTGPTGSGKTTVLDAICLALFGKTPRIDKISDKKNDILSKDTKYCFAELLFETGGKKYTARWEQNVNRNGNLNKAKHMVCDSEGVILVRGDKLTEARDYIINLIGLDFDQFIRTVMLTQGEFDRFLSSDSTDKAALFTKITGSEIYEEISKEVSRRFKEKEGDYKEFQKEIGGVELLSETERTELTKSIEQLKIEKQKLEEERDRVKESVKWLEEIAKSESVLEDIEEKEKNLQTKIAEFKPEEEKLEAADRAASIEPTYGQLCMEEGKRTNIQENLKSAAELLPEKRKALEKAKEEEEKAQEKLAAERKAVDDARPELLKVRSLDGDISHLQSDNVKSREKFAEREETLQRLQDELSRKNSAWQEKNGEFLQNEEYFQAHAEDEKLVGALSGIESALSELDRVSEKKEAAEDAVLKAQKELEISNGNIQKARAQTIACQGAFDKVQGDLTLLEERQETLLSGETVQNLEKRRDELVCELAAMRAVMDYEKQRQQLVEGQECPLCGSVHHPYVLGSIPSDSEKKQELRKAETLLESVRDCTEKIVAVRQRVSQKRVDLAEAQNELKRAEDDLHRKEENRATQKEICDALNREIEEKRTILLNQLEGYGISAETLAVRGAVSSALKERREMWQRHCERRETLRQESEQLKLELASLKKGKENAEKEYKKTEEDLKKSDEELSAKKKERFNSFGELDPEKEEQRLFDNLKIAEEKNSTAKDAKVEAQNELVRCQDDFTRWSREIKEVESVLQQRYDSFEKELKSKSFQTRAEFESVRLPSEERDRIRNQQQELENEKSKLAGKKEQAQKTLQAKKDEKKTDKTAEYLQADLVMIESRRIENDQNLKEAEKDLSIDDRNRKKVAELQKGLEIAKEEFQRWERFWTVLGKTNNAFSDFVQTLTFERVVQYANLWLKKMAPRYELVRRIESERKETGRGKGKKGEGAEANASSSNETKATTGKSKVKLDLDVIDYEQGGEVRVVENLSGGERFMVSLALALGISRLAGKNVQIDTLFLDEGFGTLDENALENAIDVLEQLQREGKMIGIVTHVEKLRGEESRIQTQILVIPQGGGRSLLAGPGVTQKTR